MLRNRLSDVSIYADVTAEPIDLATVKDFLRVSYTDDDILITSMITAARQLLELELNLSIAQKTLLITFTHDGCNWFDIPYGPVGDILDVSNSYAEGSSISFASTDYKVIGTDFKRFKSTRGYYTMKYNAGYAVLPNAIKQGMLKQIAWMYENRGDQASTGEINQDVRNILAVYSKNSWI